MVEKKAWRRFGETQSPTFSHEFEKFFESHGIKADSRMTSDHQAFSLKAFCTIKEKADYILILKKRYGKYISGI